jgi:hypothetical protein
VSISLWETHAQADAATPVAATWIREHLADRVELRSNQVGDLAFYEGVRAQPFDRPVSRREAPSGLPSGDTHERYHVERQEGT